MEIGPKEQLVLLGLERNRAELARSRPADIRGLSYRDRLRVARDDIRQREARHGWVPITLGDWLGHPLTPSESVQFSRVYKRLEAAGLVVIRGIRATEAKLTPAGEAEVKRLVAPTRKPRRATPQTDQAASKLPHAPAIG
jgi:hypothetical protein